MGGGTKKLTPEHTCNGSISSAAALLDPQSTNKLREIDQHITNKYEIAKRLGKGAYGIVWKVINL